MPRSWPTRYCALCGRSGHNRRTCRSRPPQVGQDRHPQLPAQQLDDIVQYPEIPQQEPQNPHREPEIPHEEPEVRQQEPEIVQQEPEIVQQGPVIPQQEPEIPQQRPVIPQQGPEILQQGSLIPQQGPLIPQQGPVIPQQGPVIPQLGPVLPQQGQVIPQQGPVILLQDPQIAPQDLDNREQILLVPQLAAFPNPPPEVALPANIPRLHHQVPNNNIDEQVPDYGQQLHDNDNVQHIPEMPDQLPDIPGQAPDNYGGEHQDEEVGRNAEPHGDQCSVCHRRHTASVPLHLRPLPLAGDNLRLVPRQFGDRDGIAENNPVCQSCYQYVTTERQNPYAPIGKWLHAWPAVFWTLLTTNRIPMPAESFMNFFPVRQRQSWSHTVDEWNAEFRNWIHHDPNFMDVTADVHTAKSLSEQNTSGSVTSVCNKFCFPTMRCCNGCANYIDSILTDDIRLVPAQHYLAHINPRFRSFNANRSWFRGARNDWTTPYEDLDWVVRPSVFIHPQMGLCIPICPPHLHVDARKKYFYPPTHPTHGNVFPQAPDFMAPAVVSGRVARNGRANTYTTSYPTLHLSGNSGGLSTSQISSRRPSVLLDVQMMRDTMSANGLTLTEREDIRRFVENDEQFQPGFVQQSIDYYMSQEVPAERLTQCSSAATFMDINDAYHIAQCFNDQTASTANDRPGHHGNREMTPNPDNCLFIIHENNEYGAAPFAVPQLRDQDAWFTYSVLSTLLHVRSMHKTFLNRLWQRNGLDRQMKIAELISKIADGSGVTRECHNTVHGLITHAAGNEHHFLRLGRLLSRMCTGVHAADTDDPWLYNHPDLPEADVFIVCRQRPRPGNRLPPLPAQSPDGAWKLMFCLEQERSPIRIRVDFQFRWSKVMSWQHGGTNVLNDDIGTQPFCVYVREDKLDDAKSFVLNSCGGQEKVHCLIHNIPLIATQHSDTRCCSPRCTRKVRWRCPGGLPDMQCPTSMCRKDLDEAYRDEMNELVHVGLYGPAPLIEHDLLMQEDPDDDPPPAPVDLLDNPEDEDDNDNGPPGNREEQGLQNDGDIQPIYLPNDELNEDILPLTTAYEENFVFASDCKDTILNHHLLNNTNLQLLHRRARGMKAPVATQAFLQNICCKTTGRTVPMITPEAQLFTNAFWNTNGDCVTGALPSILYSKYNVHKRNIASIIDHIRVRARDPTQVTSKSHSMLQYYFDITLNYDLNNNCASIVTQKGLEHLTRGHTTVGFSGRENLLPMMQDDANKQVRRLTALQRQEGSWDIFLTLTCNDSATPGVAPIRKAIDARYTAGNERENALQNYAVIMCRSWERTVRYVWNYILHSPEQPLGHVKSGWMRYEFQSGSALGNKPHVHAGLTLYPRSRTDALMKIQCTLRGLFDRKEETDEESLIANGIAENHSDFVRMYDLARTVQTHNCTSASSRCLKKSHDDIDICRVTRYPPSFKPTFKDKTSAFSAKTLTLLNALDLADWDYSGCAWAVHDDLLPGQWRYPADPNEHMVPTTAKLFAILQSSTNVQFCDRKFNHAYLAKYAAGIEERPFVDIRAQNGNTVDVQAQALGHEKITGQRLKMEKRNHRLHRHISLTEMIWYVCNLPYVVCDRDMTHVSTLPPEYRPAILKPQRHDEVVEGGGGEPDAVTKRLDLPFWRQFTESQKLLIHAHENGRYFMDNTGSFFIRPPELIWCDRLEMYARCFTMSCRKDYELDAHLQASPWIDGAGRQVRIRLSHFDEVRTFIQEKVEQDLFAREIYDSIISQIVQQLANRDGHDMSDFVLRFLDATKTRRNVVVLTQVTPDNPHRFFVHLLLTMGEFSQNCVTELDVYSEDNMLEAFRAVQLIGEGDPTMGDVYRITRRYILEQFQYMPVGLRRFGYLMEKCVEILTQLLVDKDDMIGTVPIVLEADMVDVAATKLEEMIHDSTRNMLLALQNENIPEFPDAETVLRRVRVDYNPQLVALENQSPESVHEQTRALDLCLRKIGDVVAGTPTRSVLLLGSPGSGKTFIALTSLTAALSQTLICAVTALTSQRARKFGGEHIHLMFCIPTEKRPTNVNIEYTLLRLKKNPIRLAYLQRLQFLLIEEIGLLPSDMLALMDTVLREIRNSSLPFGGLLIIGTGDPRQLLPISGAPVWCSHHIFYTFTTCQLQHYVRAAEDEELQALLNILRINEVTDNDVHRFMNSFRRRVLQHQTLQSWDLVPDNYLCIVGTRQGCEDILEDFLVRKRRDPAVQTRLFYAADYVEVAGGRTLPANQRVQRTLDRELNEVKELLLYAGAVVRMTFNNTEHRPNMPRFSQGQIAIVVELPQQDAEDAKVSLRLVPIGEEHHAVIHDNIPQHWPRLSIGKRPSVRIHLHNQSQGWRHQFPITYHRSLTVHRAIGETAPLVATQFSCVNPKFRMWEKEQLLVLLSRVHSLDGLLVVTTNLRDTELAITQLLRQSSPWAQHVETVLHVLERHIVRPRILVHRLEEAALPDTDVGCVYMLVSTKVPTYCYIGETKNVSRRLAEHNRGQGARRTRDAYLRPWSLYVMISNFPGHASSQENTDHRKTYELEWHRRLRYLRNLRTTETHNDGQVLFIQKQLQYPLLLWSEFSRVLTV